MDPFHWSKIFKRWTESGWQCQESEASRVVIRHMQRRKKATGKHVREAGWELAFIDEPCGGLWAPACRLVFKGRK